MNTPRRLRFSAALFGAATLAASALTLLPGAARAQTAVTDPVGYLSIALPANSDTFVSIPFTRPAEFTGAVSVAPGSTGNVLTFSGTPFTGLTLAPLATAEPAPSTGHKTYYAIIGPKNAALTPTLSVTPGSATVTASTTTPEAVAGDTITVAGYTFTVVTVSGATLTIDRVYPGTTAASGLAATYDHSPSEGRFYTVSTNDSGTLTVNLNGDTLTNVAPGTQVSLVPYWTFGTAFPATDVNKSFIGSTSAKVRGTQLLIPNLSTPGINTSTALTYIYLNNAWVTTLDTANSHNDDTLTPDSYFIVRNPFTAAQTNGSPLAFVPTGGVLVNRLTAPTATQSTVQQDNSLALIRPVSVTLNDSGLVIRAVDGTPIGGTFKVSASAKSRGDQLLVFDNTQIATNKPASATYYYLNNAWRKSAVGADANADAGADTLTPGSGYIIRKAVTTDGATTFWQNARNFLN